jgi:hypothetical protein
MSARKFLFPTVWFNALPPQLFWKLSFLIQGDTLAACASLMEQGRNSPEPSLALSCLSCPCIFLLSPPTALLHPGHFCFPKLCYREPRFSNLSCIRILGRAS